MYVPNVTLEQGKREVMARQPSEVSYRSEPLYDKWSIINQAESGEMVADLTLYRER